MNEDGKFAEEPRLLSLSELREHAALADMVTLRRGNRLSITPVTAKEWNTIGKLAARKPRT